MKKFYFNHYNIFMDSMFSLYEIFCEHHGIGALSSMLAIQHNSVLPSGNHLPPSHEGALGTIEP